MHWELSTDTECSENVEQSIVYSIHKVCTRFNPIVVFMDMDALAHANYGSRTL